MGLFNPTRADDALDRLLDQERQLILSGRIEALAQVSAEKDRLMARLGQSHGDARDLDKLRRKADRNQHLLMAVAKGIRTVSRRLDALKAQQNGRARFATYDRGGRTAQLTPGKAQFERRA
jgi:flagellar biosynthesis/type III secretory pathway chaperone